MLLLLIFASTIFISFIKFYFYKKRLIKYVQKFPLACKEYPLIGGGYKFIGKDSEPSIRFYLYKRRLMKYVKNLTYPQEYPIIGLGHKFIGKNTTEIMEIIIQLTEQLALPSRTWLGPQLVVAVSHPDDIQTVLTSPNCYEKSHVYKFLHNDLGLFSATTSLWKHDRKIITPTLNFKILMSFIPIFNDKTNLMMDSIAKEAGTNMPFDVSKYMFACTLDMVCATTLGYNTGVQENRNMGYLESWEKCIEMVANRMVRIWWHPDFIYNKTKAYKEEKVQFDIAEALPNMIIAKKKKEYFEKAANGETVKECNDDEAYSTPQIFIDQLMKLYGEGKISDLAILHQVNLMIFGGNDTSALATSHAILLLAMYPEYQDRLYEEIMEVCPEEGTYMDYEIISKLNYTEMVIKEAMRLFPVAPFLGRTCLADTPLRSCDATIPKGCLIFVSIWTSHRSKSVWGPNANEFNPDNFSAEKVAARHPYAYIPFSAGPRNCLGMKYALISMKTMLATIIRKYKFTTDLKLGDLKTKFEVTMKLVNKHMVKMDKR